VDHGIAYSEVQPGTYHPAASLYMGARVRFNFGPHFVYPPPPLAKHEADAFRSEEPYPLSVLKRLRGEDAAAQAEWVQQQRCERGLDSEDQEDDVLPPAAKKRR
jgi:hypothetical protein